MRSDDEPGLGDPGARRVDGWLRNGLAPESGSIERIVRRSLAAGAASAGRPWRAAIVGGAAAIIIAAAILVILIPGRSGGPGGDEARAVAPAGLPRITNVTGEVTVILPPERSARIAGSLKRPLHHPDNLTIFNSNGIVVAFAPGPVPHHFMIGGEP